MNDHYNPPLLPGGMNDPAQRKRVRTGSISGRLRTASDLEEIGMIDKYQKGYIKDLIISGDSNFQTILEKYEKGDKKELEDLIRSGGLGRRQSVDILDDLDFDFLNGMKTDLDVVDAFNDDFMFDFSADNQYGGHNNANSSVPHNSAAHAAPGGAQHQGAGGNGNGNGGFMSLKTRTASVDSTGSFSFFENLPYDANNAGSLMDELQYLNREYGDGPSGPYYGGAGNNGTGRLVSPTNRGEALKQAVGGSHGNSGAPHVSFSRFVSSIGGLDPPLDDSQGQHGYGGSNLSGHKGRRDSWDIAAQYIQQEEDYSRGNGSGGSRHSVGGLGMTAGGGGASWAAAQQQHQQQHANSQQKGGAGAVQGVNNANKPGAARKPVQKADGGAPSGPGSGNLKPGNGTGGMQTGNALNRSTGSKIDGGQAYYPGNNGGQGQGAGAGGGSTVSGPGARPSSGGTGTSTQHSAYSQHPSHGQHAVGSSSGAVHSVGGYEEGGQRLGVGPGFVGAYSPEQRRLRIEKFIEKRGRRVWTKKVKYDVRKNFADSRLRVKGRFVKKEDEDIMREILSI